LDFYNEDMSYKLDRKLLSANDIGRRIDDLAMEIKRDYKHNLPVFLPVLTGAFVLSADLIRRFNPSPQVEFIRASSYCSKTKSSGDVRIEGIGDVSIEGKRVLVIEDIIDTGLTIVELKKQLQKLNPIDIRIVTLLDKHERREHNIEINYIGFKIRNHFVVGYGMDYNQMYRGLQDIWIIEASEEL
jgi:hypoxanthine phosphoribosyltransferase